MENLDKLLKNLKKSGIVIPGYIEAAMRKVDVEDFTEHDASGFYEDRPVVFLENLNGGVKTISAPHMIITMLHNLELMNAKHVVVLGAKGGYLSAIIAHILGEDGSVTVIDPSIDVISQLSRNLRGYPTVSCHTSDKLDSVKLESLSRVLVTGQIEALPEWLSNGIEEDGFAIAPIGDRNSQRLLKIEKQGSELFETDLGGVIFGPVDIVDSEYDIPSPEEMAELIEQVIEMMSFSGIIEENVKSELFDLVAELRLLPDDLPPPSEMENPSEHPMMKLMMEKGEWFVRIWPIIHGIMGNRIASYGSPDDYDETGHTDFIP